MDVLIIGCGISGAVVARCLAENGHNVTIWERRNHIGGNMFDYFDEHGFLVQKFGPHAFHTGKKHLVDFIRRFEDWDEYKLTCGAVIDGKYSPTPFNLTTIDTFYSKEEADELKERILRVFGDRQTATVTEVLLCSDPQVRDFAQFLYEKDYSLYTAKQWGISPQEIDVSVLNRVPLRFSYDEGYFDDPYQLMPHHSFTHFFENLLDHPLIHIELGVDALDHISILNNHQLLIDRQPASSLVVYTGEIDALFGYQFGQLPYRSLRFDWKHEDIDSLQAAPVVAYPQEKGYTRITEFKKLNRQSLPGTSFAIEYPLPYSASSHGEPYYPVITEASKAQYEKYLALSQNVQGLVCCGRLADFKYYNMDDSLERALAVADKVMDCIGRASGRS